MSGDGPTGQPVVLVQGLIGTLDDKEMLAALSPRPVLAPDLLGYGRHADVTEEAISILAQVEHLRRTVDSAGLRRAHLVGHSVGGVVSVLFADRYPDRVASLVSVEGNFTLADAFWSAEVANMGAESWAQMFAGFRADPAGWLDYAGVHRDERTVAQARRWLELQPASTVQAMARAVVDTTARPAYLDTVRKVFVQVPTSLIAGERSREGWDMPAWASSLARRCTVIPDAGHLMMLEDPSTFGEAIARLLSDQEASAHRGD